MAKTPEQPTPPPQEKDSSTSSKKDRAIALIATPTDGEQVLFKRNKEGGLSIKIKGEVTIALSPKVAEASGAVLTDTTGVPYSLIPEGTPPPQREDSHASENGSRNETETPKEEIIVPESENNKHEFTGNPVYDAKYRVRKSGKRIADFHIATHEKKDETKYFRIRAFDGLAERAR